MKYHPCETCKHYQVKPVGRTNPLHLCKLHKCATTFRCIDHLRIEDGQKVTRKPSRSLG